MTKQSAPGLHSRKPLIFSLFQEGLIMIFEQFAVGGCRSYLVGCADTCAAALIDPEISLIDRYIAAAAREGLRIHYLIDTHTHADHFSASQQLSRQLGAPVAGHRASPAPFVDLRLDDGEMLVLGKLRLQVLYTPGHTRDSICLLAGDRVFTGDTLLMGGTGRTDLPSGDADRLYDSLFNHLLRLDPALKVYPAHDYKGRDHSTLADEIAGNPRLQVRDRAAFVEMMRNLNLSMPTHVTEALRTNISGGKTVAQMLAEAAAAVPFMALAELKTRIGGRRRRADYSRCARARCLRKRPYSGGETAAARSARIARQRGVARSHPAHRFVSRIRPYLDAGHRNAARDGVSARGGTGWRHEGLAGGGLSHQGGWHTVIFG